MQGHPQNFKFIQRFEKLRQNAIASNSIQLSKAYTQVIISLRKYPLPIISSEQAESLQGVGTSHVGEFRSLMDSRSETVNDLEWKLFLRSVFEQFAHSTGGLPYATESTSDAEVNHRPKRVRTGAPTPVVGSHSWICVVIMHALGGDSEKGVRVDEIYNRVVSFEGKYPRASKFNHKSVLKLVKQGIIEYVDEEKKEWVRFTDVGRNLSTSVWQKSLRTENLSTLLNLEEFLPDPQRDAPYELIMVIDNREFAVANIMEASLPPNVKIERRTLPVGDVIWVWRKEKSDEYMSGFAVERKTIEDLSTSITDGRWEEQRRRLARAPGIDNVIYIIEGNYAESAKRNPCILPEQNVRTAIRQTELVPGFYTMIADDVIETANILLELHARILSCESGPEPGEELADSFPTYREFNEDVHKSNNMTVGQLVSRMLRSVPGVGAEAVLGLNDFIVKTGGSGLTIKNVMRILNEPNLCEVMKSVTGAKRVALTNSALATLREQFLY